MRLWHKELIPVLPNKWLVAQWKELSAISGRLKLVGTPKHALVDKLTTYSLDHFISYADMVYGELRYRKLSPQLKVLDKIYKNVNEACEKFNLTTEKKPVHFDDLFAEWHNNKYLIQCYYNLQEKYDCGLLTHTEFEKIKHCVSSMVGGLCII